MVSVKQLGLPLLLLALLAVQSHGQDTTRAPQITPPSPVAELISQLDDPNFHVRQKATVELTRSGAEAIPALMKATENESLEVAVRALHVLRKLYLADDDQTVDRAESALEELAKNSQNRSVASRAHAVIDRYYNVIGRKRAIADILRLGGKIEYGDMTAGLPNAPFSKERPILFVTLGKNWKGGDDGLKYVKRLATLRMLYLIKGVSISDKAKDDLQRALPYLQIQYRGRAYLGIAGSAAPNGLGCWVTGVKEGHAADRAKLAAGDIITGFGGQDVPDFDALIKLIGEKQPHDKVKVDITRDGHKLTLVVELDEW